jgi:dolichyl-phosphate-mannose-protein mannosyltransferase
LAVVLAVTLAVRVLLFPIQGYENDTNTYLSWFNTAAQNGVRPFYSVVSWCDYPPFNIYLFWSAGSIINALSLSGQAAVNVLKMVPTVFDLATTTLIYLFLRKQLTFKQTLLGTALYAFNPAVIFNVAVWGQFDVIYTFFLVLSLILALKNKPEVSAVVFAAGLLTKPQGIALLPLVALLIYKKSGVRRLLLSTVAFVVTIFLVILPFEWSNPITFLSNIYFGAYSTYAYTSINAFNLWGMFGLWIPDGNLYVLGWALFGAFAAFTLYVLHKRFKVSGEWLAFFAAFMLFFAFFMLPTRIHERYLFPVISILALMFPLVKKARIFYVALTATLLANQAYVLYYLNLDAFIPSGDLVVLAISIINLVMFLYGSVLLWDELKGRSLLKTEPAVSTQPQQTGEPK